MGYGDTMGGRDLDDLPQDNGFDPIPAGWYDVTIIGVEDKATKAGDGGYLNFQFEIEGPTCGGRKIFTMHLYQHPKEDAERIGLSRLHSLARAMGRTALPRDLVSFSGARVQAKVKITKATADYEPGNEVIEYKQLDRAGAPSPGKPAVRHPAPAGFEAPASLDSDTDLPF